VALGFVSVRFRLVVPFTAIEAAPKDLVIVGGATTVTVAVFEGPPGPVSFELTGPVVLFCTPAVVPVTVTVIVQLAPPANMPPVKLRELPPEITSVPPHVGVAPLGAVNPDGRVSVKVNPVSAVPPGFVITKLMLTLPPTATVELANDFVIVGAP